MKQFAVPQFIDAEDKILGPITTRQFVLILAAGLLTFIFYSILTFMVFVVVEIVNLGFFATIAFARVNGRPIHFFLLNALQTIKRPMKRVWNKEAYVRDVHEVASDIVEKSIHRKGKDSVTGSRLEDLTLVVNTGGMYSSNFDAGDSDIKIH